MSDETNSTEPKEPAETEKPAESAESTGSAKPTPAKRAAAAAKSEQAEGRKRHLRKTLVGKVVSDGMDKTIVVMVERRVPHPKFKKIIKRSKKFFAHDEDGEAVVGDKVEIIECRPLSKRKCWQLNQVLAH